VRGRMGGGAGSQDCRMAMRSTWRSRREPVAVCFPMPDPHHQQTPRHPPPRHQGWRRPDRQLAPICRLATERRTIRRPALPRPQLSVRQTRHPCISARRDQGRLSVLARFHRATEFVCSFAERVFRTKRSAVSRHPQTAPFPRAGACAEAYYACGAMATTRNAPNHGRRAAPRNFDQSRTRPRSHSSSFRRELDPWSRFRFPLIPRRRSQASDLTARAYTKPLRSRKAVSS
jgi:hypothetical protein